MIFNKPGKIYKGKDKKFGRLYIGEPIVTGSVCTQCAMYDPVETDCDSSHGIYYGSHCMRNKWVECNPCDDCVGPLVLKEIKGGI